MRDTSRRSWQSWRVTLASTPASTEPRFARSALAVPASSRNDDHLEQPGPDGIRHALVARIKAEIEAGTYDIEERWLQAEERLLARIDLSR